ncbi:MAG: hypothetical protein NT067_06620 [Candidatus Diapherotrites archaeon]|nr:hypothetical protein [Candidatus Diapherotrites archaeon]
MPKRIIPKKPRNEIKARVAARKKARRKAGEAEYLRAFGNVLGSAISMGGVLSKLIFKLERELGPEKALVAERRTYFLRQRRTMKEVRLIMSNLNPKERAELDSLVRADLKFERIAKTASEEERRNAFVNGLISERLIGKAFLNLMTKGLTK